MADLEIFRLDENGAGWVSFDELTKNEKMDLELGVMLNDVTICCYVCSTPIPRGTGNACEKHK